MGNMFISNKLKKSLTTTIRRINSLVYYNSTVRLWDVNKEKPQKNVIKPKSQQGRRLAPTTCAYSRDGRWVAAACQDGSIQIWDHRKPFFVSKGMLQYEAMLVCFILCSVLCI